MADVEFGQRLVALLKEAGAPLTQKRLGAWLGVSGAMAWNYKQGEKLPAMSNAIAMARKLNCSVEYLLTGRGPKRIGPEFTPITERFALLKPAHQAAVAAVIESLLAAQQAEPPPDPAPEGAEPRSTTRPS
jgi:transcriptional regulator with XRE-family HTH domain